MGTTTLLSLRSKLQTAIGDKNQAYADSYTDAIKNAVRQIYPDLHRKVDDMSLITGNILPPFNWSTTALLDFYTEPAGTLLKTTDSAYYHNGPTSAKVTGSGADDGIVLDSQAYARLLDVMDTEVSLKCWVISQDADDAFLDIITTDSDGADTTESSTTTCTAGVRTLLEIEDYDVPDDITRIRIKLRVHTTAKYVYFDPPRLTGKTVNEYLLPTDLQNGTVRQSKIQASSYSDDACDDLHPEYWNDVFDWSIIQDGIYKYIRLPNLTSEYRIRLIGDCPLEDLTSDTTTISLDEPKVSLLVTLAAHLLFEMKIGVASALDISRYRERAAYWWGKYQMLLAGHGLGTPSPNFKIGYE